MNRGVAEPVGVWTVSGVPVRVFLGSRRYRVAEDPAPVFIPAERGWPAEWELELVSMQTPPERLVVTVQPVPGNLWLLTSLETL